MNSEKFMKAMSQIDGSYIQKYENPAKPQKKPMAKKLIPYAVAAAALTFATVLCISFLPGGKGKADKFRIENGILLEYAGNDTDVIIPEEVHRISGATFAKNENASSIKTLTVGKNVEYIEKDALFELTGMESITVSPDNEFYSVKNDMVVKLDYSEVFNISRSDFDQNAFFDLMDALDLSEADSGKNVTVMFGKVIITAICNEIPEEQRQYLFDRINSCCITSVEYLGHKIDINHVYFGNSETKLLYSENDGIFIYSHEGSGPSEDFGTYIFTQSGVEKVPVPDDEDYTASVYSFDGDKENSRISYTRRPVKYAGAQSLIPYLDRCVSRDEFCLEAGYISCDDGAVVYHPTEKYTIGEKYDLDTVFNGFRYPAEPNRSEALYTEYSTLDELIEHNKTLYKRAY